MNQNTTKWRRPAFLGALAIFVLFIVSCGGSSSSDNTTQAPVNDSQFRYLGNNSFNNAQSGALDFSVFGNGSASGTFTVTNDIAAQTNVAPGTYTVIGSGSLVNSIFSLSGTFPGLGLFVIQGRLPAGSAQADYAITVNNQTFQGVLQNASLGFPNPGNNNNGNNEGRLISGGTVNSLLFLPDGGYNGDNPPVDTNSTISGAFGPGANGEQTLTIALSEVFVGNTTQTNILTVSIVDPNGNDLVMNQAYNVIVNSGSAGSVATLNETVGTNTTPDRSWVSLAETTTGTATITALTDTQVTLEFNFDSMVPNSEVAGNSAAGSFDLSGSITGNFSTTP
jgi:hypothetical protein